MSNGSATNFATALRKIRSPLGCAKLFREAIEPLGFDAFACGIVDLKSQDRSVFYIIDWPNRWRDFYMASGFVTNDPVVGALRDRTEPFTWSDLRTDRKFAEAGRDALDRVAMEGWKDGLVVPIPHSDHRVGIVSLSGPNPVVTSEVRAYLCLLAMLLQGHVRNLMASNMFALPPLGLTEREIACVRLVARGLSDGAIGTALEIAPSTAHEFVEKAKRRVGVRSRPELVAVAVDLGIVSA